MPASNFLKVATSGVVVYFECRDLDQRVTALRNAGIAFESGPPDESWRWREARLLDPDNNTLCFSMPTRIGGFRPGA